MTSRVGSTADVGGAAALDGGAGEQGRARTGANAAKPARVAKTSSPWHRHGWAWHAGHWSAAMPETTLTGTTGTPRGEAAKAGVGDTWPANSQPARRMPSWYSRRARGRRRRRRGLADGEDSRTHR